MNLLVKIRKDYFDFVINEKLENVFFEKVDLTRMFMDFLRIVL